jgi:hypothetical protein
MLDQKPIVPHAGTSLPAVKTPVDCTTPRRMQTGWAAPVYIQSEHPVYIWQSDVVPEDYVPNP